MFVEETGHERRHADHHHAQPEEAANEGASADQPDAEGHFHDPPKRRALESRQSHGALSVQTYRQRVIPLEYLGPITVSPGIESLFADRVKFSATDAP